MFYKRKDPEVIEAIQFTLESFDTCREFARSVMVDYEQEETSYLAIWDSLAILIAHDSDYIVKVGGKYTVMDEVTFNAEFEPIRLPIWN